MISVIRKVMGFLEKTNCFCYFGKLGCGGKIQEFKTTNKYKYKI